MRTRRDKALERSGFLLVVNHPEHNLVELRNRHAAEFVRPASASVIALGFAEHQHRMPMIQVDGGADAG